MDIEPGIYRPEFPIDGNFTVVPNELIRAEDIAPSAKLLLIYLLSHKIGYYILDTQIMRETGMGREALRTARRHLEELGFIELIRVRQEDKSFGGYRYELQDARGWFSTVGHPTVGSPTVGQATVGNPPHNRRLIPKKTNSKKTKTDKTSDSRFDEFWMLYPRKQGKGKAREAFLHAVGEHGVEPIMAGVQRFATDPNLPDPQFIPLPTTWLNQERWDDGPLPLNRKLTNSERNIQNLRASLALLEPTTPKEITNESDRNSSIVDFGLHLRSADSL